MMRSTGPAMVALDLRQARLEGDRSRLGRNLCLLLSLGLVVISLMSLG